jgi:hypothetical protein
MRSIGVLANTDEEIRRRIGYNPETGEFWWKVTIGGRGAKSGEPMTGRLNGRGYLDIGVNNKRHLLHRVAWFLSKGEWPEHIDHIDHNRTNNRIANLRSVSNAQNMLNKGMSSRNRSGITGVDWYGRDKKWRAQIAKGKKHIWLGCFDSLLDAVAARKSAEARLGFHANHGRINAYESACN